MKVHMVMSWTASSSLKNRLPQWLLITTVALSYYHSHDSCNCNRSLSMCCTSCCYWCCELFLEQAQPHDVSKGRWAINTRWGTATLCQPTECVLLHDRSTLTSWYICDACRTEEWWAHHCRAMDNIRIFVLVRWNSYCFYTHLWTPQQSQPQPWWADCSPSHLHPSTMATHSNQW
jgi:hypothetical protein